jgi:hypothetical protein
MLTWRVNCGQRQALINAVERHLCELLDRTA